MTTDVPSSIDYHQPNEARQWAETTTPRRPWRLAFFAAFVDVIGRTSAGRPCRVLELGSGPGFLAESLLTSLEAIEYVGLDYSAAMHEMARDRLGPFGQRAVLVERSLREPDWGHDLGRFDFIVSNQVVHELRHKQHASALHAQALQILAPGGSYLVCDHFLGDGAMINDQLYMTAAEQCDALRRAGFDSIEQVLLKGDLVLHHALMGKQP